jgi:hypothetical protein
MLRRASSIRPPDEPLTSGGPKNGQQPSLCEPRLKSIIVMGSGPIIVVTLTGCQSASLGLRRTGNPGLR